MTSLGLSWLCNFLQQNVDVNDAHTNSSEKRLLTTLSTVCRHLRHIQIEDDSSGLCGRNYLTDDMDSFTFCGHRQGEDTRTHNCMNFVTETLVALMVLENDFISHSASKTLYILSCHLMESVSEWKDFVDQLWICLKGICFDVDTQPIIDISNQHSSNIIDQRPSTSGAIDTKVAYYISYLALSVQALALHNHSGDTCISDFLRHKFLILMIRLSECFVKKASFFLTWLELLGEHAADLLYHPLPEDRIHGSSLMGSPFWISSSNCKGEFDICKSHLQSRAVFLFFKFSFILIKEDLEPPKAKGTVSLHCTSLEKLSAISAPQMNPLGKSGHAKAFRSLINWLLRQISCSSASTGDASVITQKTLTLSFLRLFMDEDDLMFEMLLQLLDMSQFMQQEQHKGNNVVDDKQCIDICLPILESLKPDSLLYEFLAAIEYDDSVIVDYLISKNTGTLCLRYLLRSLRILSDLWPASTGSTTTIDDPSHLNCKREQHQLDLKEPLERKLSVVSDTSKMIKESNDGCELEENVLKRKRDGGFISLPMIDVDSSSFQRAKGCLSSLHFHIESLHRKDLFPYNPSPLLKRLERFLLLCNERQRV